eukprot:PhF_6_TR12325/c1_g1_i3/m.19582
MGLAVTFHVYFIEYLILVISIALVVLHEYVLRYRVAQITFLRLGTYHRFFLCAFFVHVLALYMNKTILNQTVIFFLITVTGIIPLFVMQVCRRRWIGVVFAGSVLYCVVYKFFRLDRVILLDEVSKVQKYIERLTPITYFIPSLHPTLSHACRGFTAHVWSMIALVFVAEMDLIHGVLMEVFVGSVANRSQGALGTDALFVLVILSSIWDNLFY